MAELSHAIQTAHLLTAEVLGLVLFTLLGIQMIRLQMKNDGTLKHRHKQDHGRRRRFTTVKTSK